MARDALTLEFETEAFRRWTRDVVKAMDKEAPETALRKIAFDFLRRVIEKTPVDTGRARGGWTSFLVAKGGQALARQAVSAPDPAGGESSPEPSAVAEGRAEGEFREGFVPLKGPFVEIVNGVRYITFLEFGTSGQAPAGMVRITFREMQLGGKLTEPMRESLRNAVRSANRRVRGAGVRRLPG